jgi:hypothetical protein
MKITEAALECNGKMTVQSEEAGREEGLNKDGGLSTEECGQRKRY